MKNINQDELKIMLNNFGLKLYNKDDYIEYSKSIACIDKDGYIVRARLSNLKSGTRPRAFHPSNPYTIINIQNWCKLNGVSRNISVDYKQIYKNAIEPMIFICSIHGEFKKAWCDFQKHSNCIYCSHTANDVWDGNNILIQRPDLVKYFKNKDDVTKYPMYSGKRISLICDKCGYEKQEVLSYLTSYGFSCSNCSDGISIPEKFARGILNQLQINYTPQKIFRWSNNKRYDFYLNDKNIIIETHGMQHYKGNWGKLSLEDQIRNDRYKLNLALKNNIHNYIIIDCRLSEDFNWLKDSFIKSLNDIINLDNIDWNELYNFTLKSNMIEACNLYNKGFKIKEICNILKISDTPIRRYLKIGTISNICDYSPKEIKRKVGLLKGIKVNQYNMDGTLINSYISMCEASRQTNISQSKISMCTNNKRKTAGGFIWEKAI